VLGLRDWYQRRARIGRHDLALSIHYFGRLDGTTLTIVRRETDVMVSGQVLFPATVDLSQLVFKRS
jgi:hypothetical protein